jgi:hypothetical protein
MAERTLDGIGEAGGVADGHVPSWCAAYLLVRWRVASWPANASASADGSLLPTLMGGGDPLLARDATYGRLS